MKLHEIYSGFTVERIEEVKEVNGTAYLMRHSQSGARLLYIDAKDNNKVFHVAFRTPPSDSTGVAHILEHSVLCGSRKFPLREPFVELVKGSMNTFLNAMTYSDKTVYPVASKNDKDFHNLMDVYLDAVFFPRVAQDPMIVMQEGWHYELESPEDELTYKGVVYNEMKGVYSSPDSILDHYKQGILFPDTTYGKDSGGYPENITDLTYEGFREFYSKFYHPSNSYIYLYGDMNIEERLAFIHEEYLSKFEAIEVDSTIHLQAPFTEGKVEAFPYGIGSDEDTKGKTIHALTYVCPEMTEEQVLAFEVATHALLTSAAAPLKEALIKANIGADVSGGYTDGILQPLWEVTVTGSEMDKQQALQDVVESTLAQLVQEGLDKELLEASLNRIEFALRESDFGGRPIGLAYGLRVMDNWLYDKNPIDILRYEGHLATIRQGLQTDYFERLLETYILNNTHKALVSVYPVPGLQEKKDEEERQALQTLKASMAAEEIQAIVDQTEALKVMQTTEDSEEALATIPLLELSDLDPVVAPIERREEVLDDMKVHFIPTPARGINYVSLYFNMEGLTADEVFYAELAAHLIGRMDTASYTYANVAKEINLHLGGFSMETVATPIHESRDAYVPLVVVRSKALASNIHLLMKLVGELIGRTNFAHRGRLVELLKEGKAIWDTDAFRQGHTLVMKLVQAQVSEIGKFKHAGALDFFERLIGLLKDETALAEVPQRLEDVCKKIFRKGNVEIAFVGEEPEYKEFLHTLPYVNDVLSHEVVERTPLVLTSVDKNLGITTAGKVQYVAKGGNFLDHGVKHQGSMSVLETVLRYDYLWNRIRVQGGAYGAFVNFNGNGNLVLCSYRDPNLKETLRVYDELPEYIRSLTLSERELRKYIIGTMSGLDLADTPLLRGGRAMAMYFSQSNEGYLTRFREEVVRTDAAQLNALADVVEAVMKDNHIVVMGNEQKVRGASDVLDEVMSLPQ